MDTLVNAIRSVGATNICMLGGLKWSNSLTRWLEYAPLKYGTICGKLITVISGNIAASWHSYNFNLCVSESCWNSTVTPVAAKVPVIAGEIGENDCNHDYIDPLMNWLDHHGSHYLGWVRYLSTLGSNFKCRHGMFTVVLELLH